MSFIYVVAINKNSKRTRGHWSVDNFVPHQVGTMHFIFFFAFSKHFSGRPKDFYHLCLPQSNSTFNGIRRISTNILNINDVFVESTTLIDQYIARYTMYFTPRN